MRRLGKPFVFRYKTNWAVAPRGAAYGLLFETWIDAVIFALRLDFYSEYGRRIIT